MKRKFGNLLQRLSLGPIFDAVKTVSLLCMKGDIFIASFSSFFLMLSPWIRFLFGFMVNVSDVCCVIKRSVN